VLPTNGGHAIMYLMHMTIRIASAPIVVYGKSYWLHAFSHHSPA
jgi:hypothetical protein